MKNKCRFRIALFGLIMSVLMNQALADVVSLRADLWCPFNCLPTSERPGFMIEVAKYGLAKGGHTVDYQLLPWTRAIQEARNGKFDGIVGASKNDAPDFIFTKSFIATMSNVYWMRNSNQWKYKGLDSLANVRLGVILGYSYGEPIDSYVKKYEADKKRLKYFLGETAIFKASQDLLTDEIDLFIEDVSVMSYNLQQQDLLSQFKYVKSDIPKQLLYIAFTPMNPKSKDYAKLIDEGILELKKNGLWEKLLKDYSITMDETN